MACGRPRPAQGCSRCLHDAPVSWTSERAGWSRRRWLGRADDAWAEVVTRGRRVTEAQGAVIVPRVLTGLGWAESLTADQVHVGDQELLHGPLEQWWLELHVVRGRVFGTIGPTQARAGLALAGALCGMVARGQARAWVDWSAGWALREGQVRRTGATPVGVRVGRGDPPGPTRGVEGALWRAMSVSGGDLSAVVASREPADGGHRWLGLRDPDEPGDQSAALLEWISEEPGVSAAMVRELLRGLGLAL